MIVHRMAAISAATFLFLLQLVLILQFYTGGTVRHSWMDQGPPTLHSSYPRHYITAHSILSILVELWQMCTLYLNHRLKYWLNSL